MKNICSKSFKLQNTSIATADAVEAAVVSHPSLSAESHPLQASSLFQPTLNAVQAKVEELSISAGADSVSSSVACESEAVEAIRKRLQDQDAAAAAEQAVANAEASVIRHAEAIATERHSVARVLYQRQQGSILTGRPGDIAVCCVVFTSENHRLQ